MDSVIGSFIVGLIVIVLGISNCRGNISTLHRYHRHRVTEEDRKPFGKLVGSGTILCGVGIMVNGIFTFLAQRLQNAVYSTLGMVIMVLLLLVGIGISFYGMIKYNKGIF